MVADNVFAGEIDKLNALDSLENMLDLHKTACPLIGKVNLGNIAGNDRL